MSFTGSIHPHVHKCIGAARDNFNIFVVEPHKLWSMGSNGIAPQPEPPMANEKVGTRIPASARRRMGV